MSVCWRPAERLSRSNPIPVTNPAVAALVVCVILAGCSGGPSKPISPAAGLPQANFDAELNPGTSSFVLTPVPAIQPGGTPAEVELVGSTLTTDPATETVSVDVSIRNASRVGLSRPAQVWLSDFGPGAVEVRNADFTDPTGPDSSGVDVPRRFGFDYSLQLGADSVLAPGETSQSRTWQFHVPGLTSFSFAAVVTFGGPTEGPVIAGRSFHDLDGDGRRDPGEPSFAGTLVLRRPDGTTAATPTRQDGSYSFPVREAGLHTLTLQLGELGCPCQAVPTTPNPLQVLLTLDESGQPRSFLHADFGVRIVQIGDLQPVVLTDRPPEQIRQDPYRMDIADLLGDVLVLHVTFAGCTPIHDFTMFMSGGFQESNPVQARLVLGHTDLDENCDAAFDRRLRFDLTPVRRAFEQSYGRPGPVLLQLIDLEGNRHAFLYNWGPPTGEELLPNGGFERDGQPTLEGWELMNPALASVVPADAPDGGGWALRLEADWAPTTGIVRAPVVDVAAGETLRLSAWVRSEGDWGGGLVYLTSGGWTSEALQSQAEVWTPVELTVAPPISQGDTLWVVLSSFPTEIARRVGLFDRVVLERAPRPIAGR